MKKYNVNTDKIETLGSVIVTSSGSLYTAKLTEAQFISMGYYSIRYDTIPNRRYYTYTETGAIVGNEYVVSYTPVERPIVEVQDKMLVDLKEAFLKYVERPRVDTGLGFFVDGARTDKENFEIGKKHSIMSIKDADNNVQTITLANYDTIISAIELHGISLMQIKWTKQAEIMALTTVADCILYEATPYQATVDIIDPDTLLPTGQTEVITKYKNNVKEW